MKKNSLEQTRQQSIKVWSDAQRRALHEAVRNTPVNPIVQNISDSVAAGASGTGSGGTATANNYIAIYNDSIFPLPAIDSLNNTSFDVDTQGNTCSLFELDYNGDSNKAYILAKIDANGSFLDGSGNYTNSSSLSDQTPPDFSPNNICAGTDGYFYITCNNYIAKVDSNNEEQWSKSYNADVRFSSSVQFGTNLYVLGFDTGNDDEAYFIRYNSATGQFLNARKITISDGTSSGIYSSAAIKVDSQGRPIFNISWSQPGIGYVGLIVKMSADLSDLLWYKKMDETAINQDCDIVATCVDGNDNVYANAYFASVYKLSSNGTPVWWKESNNGEFLYTTCKADGTVYWIGDDNSKMYIHCLSTDGVHLWSTQIDDTLTGDLNDRWPGGIPSEARIKTINGVEYLMFLASDAADNEIIFKLPTTQYLGTVGNRFIFTDATGDFTFSDVPLDTLISAFTNIVANPLSEVFNTVIVTSGLTLETEIIEIQ
jgi:hypothetical protein